MDIDKQIMERNPDFIKDFSFRTGLGGILLYVMVRLSSQQKTKKTPFNESYLLQLKKIAEDFSSAALSAPPNVNVPVRYISANHSAANG